MYKILHKPTGLYFCPSREVKGYWTRPEDGRKFSNYVKSNLSKTGKIYTKRPTLKYIGGIFWNHLEAHPSDAINVSGYVWLAPRLHTFIEAEWEIVEV